MIHEATYQWYAIHTKYKCEKYVVAQLQKKNIEAYVPLLHQRKQYVRKIKDVALPLINCYAFVFISKKEYVSVLSTQYALGFLKIGGKISPIPEAEMQLMKKVVGEKHVLSISPIDWAIGDPVEVIGGSLTGVRGKLVAKKGKKEFIVDLSTIGFQLQMDIEDHYLRPLRKQNLTAVG